MDKMLTQLLRHASYQIKSRVRNLKPILTLTYITYPITLHIGWQNNAFKKL